MRSIKSFLVVLSLTLSQAAQGAFKAHEWGTFTSLVGSNGITQQGLFHEDEPLPSFVHGFGETLVKPTPRPTAFPRPCHGKACMPNMFLSQSAVTQKMETPVLYFYSDIMRKVSVNVRFPQGVVTET